MRLVELHLLDFVNEKAYETDCQLFGRLDELYPMVSINQVRDHIYGYANKPLQTAK